jgi:uncharacterized protein (TIGR02996 family)
MRETEGFLKGIAESIYDDTPRLIFADWLEDHGDPDRADFIRVQCELEPMRDQYEIDRAAELHRREDELLREHRAEWLGEMPEGWDRWQAGAKVEFRRGFVDIISIPVRTFLGMGPKMLGLHPTVRRVALFRVNGYGERVAACPILGGLAELELACWYSDADAEAIAASPHLTELQVLELWLGRKGELRDDQLCRIMAGSKGCPRLRELTLLNPDGEEERTRKRLVKTANRAAGRNVAVYHRGYPELFPFADGYRHGFPGHLSDGRMAMASEDDRTSPPTLSVIAFDKKGNQTDDVLTVPFPADLLTVPPEEWYRHRERMKQHLIDTIGFRPGFIRIRDCRFPWDEHGYLSPCRGHEEYWEDQLGYPDVDDEGSWQEEPDGIGGRISWLLRNGEYVVCWGEHWADKRGTVQST